MRPKRSIARRCCNLYDDCAWWWHRNFEGLIGGFALGLLAGIIVVELVWRL